MCEFDLARPLSPLSWCVSTVSASVHDCSLARCVQCRPGPRPSFLLPYVYTVSRNFGTLFSYSTGEITCAAPSQAPRDARPPAPEHTQKTLRIAGGAILRLPGEITEAPASMPHACGAAKAGCSTALFSRQAGNTSLSESMKESEGSEVSQALTAASAKAPDDDEPASDAAVAGSSSESRPESMSPMPSEACTNSGGRRQRGGRRGRGHGGKVGAGAGGRAGGGGGAREPRALRRACMRTCAGYGLGERGAARERRGCTPSWS